MVYNKKIWRLIVRIVLILFVLTLLSGIILNPDKLFSIIILCIILTVQVIDLINFELKSFHALENVLSSIEFEHQSVRFTKSLPKSMKGFLESLNKILDVIEKKKSENEVQLLFLGELLNHIKTGIISVSDDQNVELVNEAALKILGIKKLTSLDQLKNIHPLFYQEIKHPSRNESNIVEITSADITQNLSVQISHFISQGKKMKLISFQDIRSQIEYREMEAWHQLIRTLGHEILNSVTPISSMTETSIMLLQKPDKSPKKLNELSDQHLDKILAALKTINRRSIGLLEFINNYRKLTRMPVPVFESVNLNELAISVFNLMDSDFKKEEIKPALEISQNEVIADIDKSMIEQVMINLIRNAIYAVKNMDRKIVQLEILHDEKYRPVIRITDNGQGIPEEIKHKIFIPFFTTKESGSGIGLSLARQILQLHGGSINFHSTKTGTTFTLTFKNRDETMA